MFVSLRMAQWLSWLERRPVTAKVVDSSPIWVVEDAESVFRMCYSSLWGLSSAGRASALQAEGHRFEPYRPHYYEKRYGGCAIHPYGVLAQLGEHLPYKQRVIGSSPIGPIIL